MYIRFFKPFFDFVLALTAFVILIPFLLSIAFLVWYIHLSHPIFKQIRIGQHARPFIIYKFKTITKAGNSTPFLQWLRNYKIDELPQLINILKFEMSIVGPRPDIPGYYNKLEEPYLPILKLKPGITGYASLAFSDEEHQLKKQANPLQYNDEVIFPKKLQLNLQYSNEVSFSKDLQIIFKTLFLYFK